nr:Globin domain containing protein [Haemonchus contortus]
MADVKKACLASMACVPLGRAPNEVQNGKDFYKYSNSVYRFEKLGTGLLMSVHILANIYDNEMVFRAFCRDLMDRHVGRGVDPALWKAFWGVWVAFLESKGAALSADQKAAWEKLGTLFNEECQKQLAKHGLPHL